MPAEVELTGTATNMVASAIFLDGISTLWTRSRMLQHPLDTVLGTSI
jgi:hypothetical protein